MSELNSISLINDATLEAYYRFETGALTTDSSTKGKTLTNNGTVGEEASGRFGYCADQGTSNSTKYFSIANKCNYTGGAYSIAGWWKIRTEPTATGVLYWVGDSVSITQLRLYYFLNGSDLTFRFGRSRIIANDFTDVVYTMGTTSWHHLVLTYDGTNYLLYIDKVSQGGSTSTGNGSGSTSDFLGIGSEGSQFASSYIDDVACFSKALSQTEINNLYEESGAFLAFL